jgi:tRNA threonylcarbamoyladenosine biosynthesis protein TsaB
MILAIDTATRYAGIALYDGQAVLFEENWRSCESHTRELTPAIARALAQQGVRPDDLSGLVVSLGPGSFTGLRIGLSVAKGMAFVTGKPLLGIPTLDSVGYACACRDRRAIAVIEAGRGRFCTATYLRTNGLLERLDEYRIAAPDELLAGVELPVCVCGEIGEALRQYLRAQFGEAVELPSPAESLRRAGFLAEMGWQRLQRGERDNPASLSPIYLHYPSGEPKHEL